MKLTVVYVMAWLAVCTADAQESRWNVKPMAGMTLTTLVGDDTSDVSTGLGWGLGLEGEYRMSDRLGLSVGAIYTINRFDSGSAGISL